MFLDESQIAPWLFSNVLWSKGPDLLVTIQHRGSFYACALGLRPLNPIQSPLPAARSSIACIRRLDGRTNPPSQGAPATMFVVVFPWCRQPPRRFQAHQSSSISARLTWEVTRPRLPSSDCPGHRRRNDNNCDVPNSAMANETSFHLFT